MSRRIGLGIASLLACVTASVAQETPPADWVVAPPAPAAQPGAVVPAQYSPPAALEPLPGTPPAGRYGAPPAARPTPPAGAAPARATPQPKPRNNVASAGLTPIGTPRVDRAKVSKGSGTLPNDAGQVWREYDIRPYTQRVSSEPKPQQRIVDWVLRETGHEAWHSETFGILNASREKLTVYHTPAMQAIVADIVDRFVSGRAADQSFSMRVLTVRNPDWRVKALGLMTPLQVRSPGLQGWTLPKENFALLMAELGRRADVRDYNAAGQLVPNGQGTVFSTMRPRGYIKGIVPTQQAWPGYQPETGTIEEGASLEFSPLLSRDLRTAEAMIKLQLSQVERMRRVSLDLPAPAIAGASGNQRLQIEVPQITQANLNERFRWPADQVLVLSMGLVATPGPDQGGALSGLLPEAMKAPPRADALLLVEAKNAAIPTAGPTAARGPAGTPARTAVRSTPTFSGRY